MMYLTQLVLNPRSWSVRRDLGNCFEMHRLVMSGFPDVTAPHGMEARAYLDVLYRVEPLKRDGHITVLVQSRLGPDWSCLPTDYLLDEDEIESLNCKFIGDLYDGIESGQALAFRLRANPTKKARKIENGETRLLQGQRVALRGESELVDWLRRRGEQHGFCLLSAREAPAVHDLRVVQEANVHGWAPGRESEDEMEGRSKARRITISSVLYEGHLRVTEVNEFRKALQHGIGPGKAFGMGLLSVAPPAP